VKNTRFPKKSPLDKIQTAIDNRDTSCGIFVDFSKAFNMVNHDILIKKLDNYGIRGIAKNCFLSNLSDQQQSVIINNVTTMSISCEIPQGSVLGPILFLLYIDDFHLCSVLFDFHLFADDANLFHSHKNIDTSQQNINSGSVPKKSNFIIFHPSQKKTFLCFCIRNGKALSLENRIKYLGIFIDSNLT
jgi:hypothetical protein